MAADCDWPVNVLCCSTWDSYPPEVQAYASKLAGQILWMNSGRQFQVCTRVVRPCRRSCSTGVPPGGWWSSGSPWFPHIQNGVWVNTCSCTSAEGCSCGPLCEVRLPGPVAAIGEITIDGVIVPADAYWVYDGRDVVRVDGECWPACQDYAADVDEVGSFVITYDRGVAVPDEGQALAGVLACELAKACVNDNSCRLPKRVSSVTRQGVQVSFVDPKVLAELRITGIPEVDMWTRAINPNGLAQTASVWSPDLPSARRRTL